MGGAVCYVPARSASIDRDHRQRHVTPESCPDCHGPISYTARYCLKCGARTGRRPAKPFTFLAVIFFAVAGGLLATSWLPWLTPSASRRPALAKSHIGDARVLADSFCAVSDTHILRLYALLAEGDRDAAAALVLTNSKWAVHAGTVVHEYQRAGRLSRIRMQPNNAKTCWIPTIMLSSLIERTAAHP
jgi:hypothetical protein